MAEEVFYDISNSIESFKGLDYDELGELGVQLKSVDSKSTAKI
jgi:hypothetical protein